MKAIIVIDLNDTTLREWNTDTSKCWAEIKVHTPIKRGTHGIGCVYANNDVELKPMPKRMLTLAKMRNGEILNNNEIQYMKGRNDCIDEILGEEE